jgi:signal transduction histidine kinase
MNALADATSHDSVDCDQARSVDPRQGGLFSALSREMCRPLISLHAGFDLLLAGCEGQITPTQRDQLLMLRTQCHALIGLTRSFLDYAGPSREARTLDLAPFRLGALLAESDRQFAGRARSRGIDWSCRLEGEDARVVTDLACFQQVLGKVVTNALAHTPEGGRIAISGRIEGETWRVDVEDDGRGIPSPALDRVFDPLTRAGSAPDGTGGPGHGMGLAVCREMVGRLGGEIGLESEPGRGTTVSLRFSGRPPSE